MTARRTRQNGEGSIFPYRNGFAAYVWVVKPDGKRGRKWAYGKIREDVHDKWIKLHNRAKNGPVATRVPAVADYVTYWLEEVVRPNLAPGSYITYEGMARRYIVPGLGPKRLDSSRHRTSRPGSTRCGGSASAAPRARTLAARRPSDAAAPSASAASRSPRPERSSTFVGSCGSSCRRPCEMS
jgi:hypothetical protein